MLTKLESSVIVLFRFLSCQFKQLILKYGVDVFDKNDAGETACDLAMLKERQKVATLLESRMVFSVSVYVARYTSIVNSPLCDDECVYTLAL